MMFRDIVLDLSPPTSSASSQSTLSTRDLPSPPIDPAHENAGPSAVDKERHEIAALVEEYNRLFPDESFDPSKPSNHAFLDHCSLAENALASPPYHTPLATHDEVDEEVTQCDEEALRRMDDNMRYEDPTYDTYNADYAYWDNQDL